MAKMILMMSEQVNGMVGGGVRVVVLGGVCVCGACARMYACKGVRVCESVVRGTQAGWVGAALMYTEGGGGQAGERADPGGDG